MNIMNGIDIETLTPEEKQYVEMVNARNNHGLSEFEGYSPAEMYLLLYDTFGKECPLQLAKLTDLEYKQIPLLNQIKFLASVVVKHGELKLTNTGCLPTGVVSDIYNQGFIKDEMIEMGISKPYRETDARAISLTRFLFELTGLVKKRNNKLSTTKSGEKLLNDNQKLLQEIFLAFGIRFRWGYFDRYYNDEIGQTGFGFSMLLLSKYGNEGRLDTFYSEKYFRAFPMLMPNTEKDSAIRCYSIRTFDRFLDYFGLVKIEKKARWSEVKHISKTDLYDKLIKCSH